MTENEAIKELCTSIDLAKMCAQTPERKKEIEAYNTAINALEEIQKYRAIGTVEELKSMKENGAFTGVELAQLAAMQMRLKEYSAIGTIEEFKALKEKNTPQELAEHNFQDEVHHYLCPSCRSIVSCNQNYCEECGQALET